MTLPNPFPSIDTSQDYNPAIRLFGNRLITEQTVLEYTTEFLAVLLSHKSIDGNKTDGPLPSIQALQTWPPDSPLKYKPSIKLNLKLFSFLGASRVEGKHEVHEQQYRQLVKIIEDSIKTNHGTSEQVMEYLEDFLRGFQGAGFNRAWCAQSFYPISNSVLTQETIWNETVANNSILKSWQDTLSSFKHYYSVSKHRFMARGGEVLYLQLCNVFRMDISTQQYWADNFEFAGDEKDLGLLYDQLTNGFLDFRNIHTSSFDQLVNYIEGLDPITHSKTNSEQYWLEGGWCPEESWPEGYLFAVELKRLFGALLDPVERIELLVTGCALQVLRTLCAQSVRHGGSDQRSESPLGYDWILSSTSSSIQQRRISQRSLQEILAMIQKALREDELHANAGLSPKGTEKMYKEADTKYGFKLFNSLGKKLGMIVPYTGVGARFIMTDRLLRYFVITLLQPGERVTYQDFLQRMYIHYGIAIEGDQLTSAIGWTGLPPNSAIRESKGSWLAEMLRAGGFLTELSDAWSVVRNPFGDVQ